MRQLKYKEYQNKVLGGWVGKCAGGILGAPIEGFKRFNEIALSDTLFENNFPNDDLDLQILWLDMALKKGPFLEPRDFSEHWKDHVDFPWNEYGVATRNIALGLHNPDSGTHNNNYWNRSMGSPIRSEIWGMLCPGQPERAAAYAKMDSTVDHTDFSVEAEQYLSACAAMAFFEHSIEHLLEKGLAYIDPAGICHQMIKTVIDWNSRYDYQTVAGKIKSYYGDADFTSAPMNVAFTILSLLHSGKSFDSLIDALRLGHDSDCIVATAGALLGIMVGNKNLPEQWKNRVGNELMVSPEIVGIYCPDTITELTELTCKAGIHFSNGEAAIEITEASNALKFQVPKRTFQLTSELINYPNLSENRPGELSVTYKNLDNSEQHVRVECTSNYLVHFSKELLLKPETQETTVLALYRNQQPFSSRLTSLPYRIDIFINNRLEKSYENGIPQYGNWLLLGPFIEDDRDLEAHHPKYPDHGLSELPSATYMNHDKTKSNTQFLLPEHIASLIADKKVFDEGFHATALYPQEMNFWLGEHFYGKGERTLYLYTHIITKEESKKWLCLGTTSYVTVWHEETAIYQSDVLKRKWPTSHFTEIHLKKGKNALLIRLDTQIDDFAIEIGLKDHEGKHPHQSQCNTTLQFDITEEL